MPLNDQQKSALEFLDAAFPDGYTIAAVADGTLGVHAGNTKHPFGLLVHAAAIVGQTIGQGFIVAPVAASRPPTPTAVNVPGMGKGRLLSS